MNRRLLVKNKIKRKLFFKQELEILTTNFIGCTLKGKPIAQLLLCKHKNLISFSAIERRCNGTAYGRAVINKVGYSRHFLKSIIEHNFAFWIKRRYF